MLKTTDFDYFLPDHQIAQHPLSRRDQSNLLCLNRNTGAIDHQKFDRLAQILQRPSLLIVNDTRVFPARLRGKRASGGQVELLLIRKRSAQGKSEIWQCLGKPRRKLKTGTTIDFDHINATVISTSDSSLDVEFKTTGVDLLDALEKVGQIPLPPYIKRDDEPADRDRYQTIFAKQRSGSVAAPTAGLHFTEGVVEELRSKGHHLTSVTLHVGPGTFRPVRAEILEDHVMDGEWYEISEEAASAIAQARTDGKQIIAVGTTVVRTIESVGKEDGIVRSGSGVTELFIYPGHRFRVIDGLLTNFHLPKSTLLALVCAFAGKDKVIKAYGEAVDRGYRFYSYGDSMLIQ